MIRRNRGHGFTLIEVLVTMVITALLVTLLLNSLYHVMQVDEVISRESSERELGHSGSAWLTRVLETCLPAESAGHRLIGDDKRLSCDTLSPLASSLSGMPLRIELTLTNQEQASRIDYRELEPVAGAALPLLSLPVSGARFRYVDSKGQWLSSWPPPFKSGRPLTLGQQEIEALPTRIVVSEPSFGDAEAPKTVFHSVFLLATPWLFKREIPFFLQSSP